MMRAATTRRLADLEKSHAARRGGDLLVLPGDLAGDDWLASVFNLELEDGRRGLRLNTGVSALALLATLEMLYGPDPPPEVLQ